MPFLPRELIRRHATEAKVLYEKRIGRPTKEQTQNCLAIKTAKDQFEQEFTEYLGHLRAKA